MKNFAAAASLATLLSAFVPVASAQQVLDFESLATPGPTQTFFTAAYEGFNFGNNNLATTDWLRNSPPGATYPSPAGSGLVAVGVDPGAPVLGVPADIDRIESSPVNLVSGDDFYLFGAWFSGFSTDSVGAPALINFNLYNNGSLVGTSVTLTPNTTASLFLDVGALSLVAIDAFTVVGPAGFFLMDDLTYSLTPIPEASTYAMMLLGLAGIGAVARRKAKTA